MEYDWIELFPSHIWKRGLDYYQDGRVLDVRYRDKHTICADVEGTELYAVSVTLEPKSGRIEDFYCDCPYGEDGTPCKHLAALLCFLDDNSDIDTWEEGKNKTPEIEESVKLLSEQQMRNLLIQFAQDSSYIREKIHLTAAKALPKMQKMQWKLPRQ